MTKPIDIIYVPQSNCETKTKRTKTFKNRQLNVSNFIIPKIFTIPLSVEPSFHLPTKHAYRDLTVKNWLPFSVNKQTSSKQAK
jgi:hypothetical protein